MENKKQNDGRLKGERDFRPSRSLRVILEENQCGVAEEGKEDQVADYLINFEWLGKGLDWQTARLGITKLCVKVFCHGQATSTVANFTMVSYRDFFVNRNTSLITRPRPFEVRSNPKASRTTFLNHRKSMSL
jgi:hypothetical protein